MSRPQSVEPALEDDIADQVDLDPGTVTEHMQKIVSRVFDAVGG